VRDFVVLSILVLLMVPVLAEGGTNESTVLDGTSLVSVETAAAAAANQDFAIAVEIDASAASNGTQVNWTTQICINSGVCYAPETTALSPDSDNRLWNGSIVMDEESSYINWRIELEWPDGNTSSVPETGFGWKVWSTCWYDIDNELWGGDDALDGGCADKLLDREQEDKGWLPGFGGALAAVSTVMAAFMARRD
jgi:hypothetical protein